MGHEICTCLNDVIKADTEDLSRDKNENNTTNNNKKKKVNKKPKVVLHRKNSNDSENPFQSVKEKDSISTNLNSEYKNTLSSHQPIQNKKENNNDNSNNDKNTKSKKNLENNVKKNSNNNNENIVINKNINNKVNNSNNNNKNNNKKNDVKNLKNKKEESIDLNKILNREHMVSENFIKFFNSEKGQDMILNMNEPKNKICITLHKYFVSLITRRKFKKYVKYYQEERNNLFKKCYELIYNLNPNLKKLEEINIIKYSPDGYKQYYSDPKDQEKMKFDPKKESFDNCIIINYEEDDSSSIDKLLWIYQGQVNKVGLPHGLGEKIFKTGNKQKGYWKEGQMYGWGMLIDITINCIFIGPFFDDKGVTGLGEKFTMKKRALYKGELLDGDKSGKGEEDSNEGYFVGNFYHDKKNGKGKMIYKLTGDEYEGDYKNDLFDGKGHYIWKETGQQYDGDYKNGLMHGKGLFEYSEGEYYRGDFVNGKKEGEGELHMGNGRSFIGPFVNGRPNGVGIFDNGINFKGEIEFNDGKMNINYMKQKYEKPNINTTTNNENNNVHKDEHQLKG
jgi:hypothetical protein